MGFEQKTSLLYTEVKLLSIRELHVTVFQPHSRKHFIFFGVPISSATIVNKYFTVANVVILVEIYLKLFKNKPFRSKDETSGYSQLDTEFILSSVIKNLESN
jgi:hypothetical protein